MFSYLGSFCGKLSSIKSSDLGSIAIREAIKRASLQPSNISDVIMGQVSGVYLDFTL